MTAADFGHRFHGGRQAQEDCGGGVTAAALWPPDSGPNSCSPRVATVSQSAGIDVNDARSGQINKKNSTGMPNFLSVLLTTAFLAFSGAASAQVELVFDPQSAHGPVVVNAGLATFERGTGITQFHDGVVVTQDRLRLVSDEAEVKTVSPDSPEIDYVSVSGNVEMTTEGGRVTARYGIYSVQQGLIRLQDNIRVKTESFTLTGQNFVYELETGKSRLSGKAAADITTSGQ